MTPKKPQILTPTQALAVHRVIRAANEGGGRIVCYFDRAVVMEWDNGQITVNQGQHTQEIHASLVAFAMAYGLDMKA